MFWIKTQQGDLVNLSLASQVMVYTPSQKGQPYQVSAWLPGGEHSNRAIISSHAKKEDAQGAVNDLHDMLKQASKP